MNSQPHHTITKAEGPVVLEIDGRPALDIIAQLLGGDANKTVEDYPLFVTLGVYRGDRFDPFREEDYANRLCVADVRDPNMANINGIAAFYRMRNTPRFQALLRRMDLLQ